MLTSYVFNSALNLDKCFQNTPPSTLAIDDLQLPKDWLSELEKQCRRIKPNLEKNIFLKHVGTSSKYKLKAVLLKQLSFIFYQISGHLHSKTLKHESIQLLLLGLTENIEQCTPGFHIRVNKLVNSLQIPDTLEQLLYLVRKNIVQEIAYNLMVSVPAIFQVHVVDRVYRIAKKQGLGIESHIQKDRYKSKLSGQTIRERLQSEFPKHYTPLTIPFLLAEQLQFILNQSGYTGSEKTGYAIGPAESMLKIIQNFITNPAKPNSNKLQPLFILDTFDEFGDPTRIYDLNWPLIRQLFQKLIEESYYTYAPEPANLIEYAYFQSLKIKNANPEQELKFFNYYINGGNYAALIEDLILIHGKFPDYWEKIIKIPIIIKNIDNFLSFLENKSKNNIIDNEFLKKENQIYLSLFSQDKEFILRKIIVGTKNCITDVNHNLLLKSVRYSPEITKDFFNLLFNTPSRHTQKLFLHLLFQKNSKDNDLLMFAARYHKKTITLILHFLNKYIDQIEKEKISALFIQQNNDGWNILSLAARHQTDAISCIFDFINRNPCYFDYEIFRTILYKQNDSGWNFLQILIRYQSENQINNFLDFISEKFQFSNNKKWLEIILNNTHTKHLLYLANRSNKNALNSILDFISKHIKQLDFQVLQNFFSDQNAKGWHCLHNVACSNSTNLKLILEFIQKHIDQFDTTALNDLFLAQNQAQENFLQLAVHYQSAEAVDSIFKFFSQHIELFDRASLQQLLLQQNSNGWNLLSMAYRQPANLKLILDFINEHSDSFDAETIKKIILQKNKHDYTCLHYAARFQPDSLEIILDFIDQHFGLFAHELKLLFENSSKFQSVTTLFRKPTSNTINLLTLSLKHQHKSAELISKFLKAHMHEFNLEKNYLKNFINQATNKALLAEEDLTLVVPWMN